MSTYNYIYVVFIIINHGKKIIFKTSKTLYCLFLNTMNKYQFELPKWILTPIRQQVIEGHLKASLGLESAS